MVKVIMLHEWDKDGYLWLIIKVGQNSTKDMSDPEESKQELEDSLYMAKEVMRFKYTKALQVWIAANERRLALALQKRN